MRKDFNFSKCFYTYRFQRILKSTTQELRIRWGKNIINNKTNLRRYWLACVFFFLRERNISVSLVFPGENTLLYNDLLKIIIVSSRYGIFQWHLGIFLAICKHAFISWSPNLCLIQTCTNALVACSSQAWCPAPRVPGVPRGRGTGEPRTQPSCAPAWLKGEGNGWPCFILHRNFKCAFSNPLDDFFWNKCVPPHQNEFFWTKIFRKLFQLIRQWHFC